MTFPLRSGRSGLQACILAMLACTAGGSALAASIKPAAIGRLLACRNIAAAADRLQCFDHAAAALARDARAGGPAVAAAGTRAAGSASSPPPAAADRAAAALNPRQTFGLSPETILAREVATGMRPKGISSITARIAALQTAPDGRVIYRLDDGQTWEELENNGYAPPVKSGDRVRISRGWLDSYWMQTASGRGCKVQRLR